MTALTSSDDNSAVAEAYLVSSPGEIIEVYLRPAAERGAHFYSCRACDCDCVIQVEIRIVSWRRYCVFTSFCTATARRRNSTSWQGTSPYVSQYRSTHYVLLIYAREEASVFFGEIFNLPFSFWTIQFWSSVTRTVPCATWIRISRHTAATCPSSV